MKKRYQKIHINKIQSEPDDLPVSVDLNSNNSNLNSGPNCALFQLKSPCPLFGSKINVSAFPTKNRRVGFSNEKSTCRTFPLGRQYITFGNYRDSVSDSLNVYIDNITIKRVNYVIYLEVFFYYNMKWDIHIQYIVYKTKYLTFVFSRLA